MQKVLAKNTKRPDYIKYRDGTVLVPLHINDQISSLSAILLNNEYYDLMKIGRRVVDGVGVLGAEYLIPFKKIELITQSDTIVYTKKEEMFIFFKKHRKGFLKKTIKIKLK